MRITKKPEVRKKELIEAAKFLFEKNGYEQTKIIDITRHIDVAKGTFYHYFESKNDILTEIVRVTLDDILDVAHQLTENPSLSGLEKIRLLLHSDKITEDLTRQAVTHLEMPDNRALQEKTAVETIKSLTPIIVSYLNQAYQEGEVTKIDDAEEKVEIILSAAHFLIDAHLFEFTDLELTNRHYVIWYTFESMFGIKEGYFSTFYKK